MDKLIDFLGKPDWWEALPQPGRAELESIALALLPATENDQTVSRAIRRVKVLQHRIGGALKFRRKFGR